MKAKAALVFDKPNNCYECPISVNEYGVLFCNKSGECVSTKDKPFFCNLITLPERLEIKETDDEYMKHYKQGVNDTLSRIKGELMQTFSED